MLAPWKVALRWALTQERWKAVQMVLPPDRATRKNLPAALNRHPEIHRDAFRRQMGRAATFHRRKVRGATFRRPDARRRGRHEEQRSKRLLQPEPPAL